MYRNILRYNFAYILTRILYFNFYMLLSANVILVSILNNFIHLTNLIWRGKIAELDNLITFIIIFPCRLMNG